MKYLKISLLLLQVTLLHAMEENKSSKALLLPYAPNLLDTHLLQLNISVNVTAPKELKSIYEQEIELIKALKNCADHKSKSKILTRKDKKFHIDLQNSEKDLSKFDQTLLSEAQQYITKLQDTLSALSELSNYAKSIQGSIEILEKWQEERFVE